ncbi:MAG: FAD:protein FMN transferase [Paracoccaceae bacterium]
MSIDTGHIALNGPVMGTRWSAVFRAPEGADIAAIRAALAASVEEVDRQMSTWNPASDLMRLNDAAPGVWIALPRGLMAVLKAGLEVGRASGGAFDIALGDLTNAWGFGPQPADATAMRKKLGKPHLPAHEMLELDETTGKARKRAPLTLDLSGIAKGYGVDRMMAVLQRFGIENGLVGLDGELRANGCRADGSPWTIAVERPDYEARAPMSILALEDAAVATSGDYRHWVEIGGRRLSHTMDRRRGGPVANPLASVSVVAGTCMEADAWATALMVAGAEDGVTLARDNRLNALFIERRGTDLAQISVGPLFEDNGAPAGHVPDRTAARADHHGRH